MPHSANNRFQRKSSFHATLETLVFSTLNAVLSFGKSIIIAIQYGAGVQADVFYAAQNFVFAPTALISGSLTAIAIPRYQAASDKAAYSYSYLLSLLITLSGIAGLFALVAGPASSLVFFGLSTSSKPLLIKIVMASLPVIILMPLSALFDNINRADKVLLFGNVGRLTNTLLSLVLLVGLSRFGAMGMTGSAIGGVLIEFFILSVFFFRRFKFPGSLNLRDGFSVMTKSMPVLVGGILSIVSLYFERYLASFLQSGTITLHSMATSISGILRTILVGSMIGVFYPFIAELIVANRKEEYYLLQDKIKKVVFGWLGFLMIAACAVSYPLFYLVYGHGKFDLRSVQTLAQQFSIMAFGVVFSALGNVNTFVYYSKMETRVQQLITLVVVALTAVLQWSLMPSLGIKALAIGTAVSSIVNLGMDYFFLKRLFGYRVFIIKDMLTILIIFASTLAMGLLSWSPLFLLLPVVYFAVVSMGLYRVRPYDIIDQIKSKFVASTTQRERKG